MSLTSYRAAPPRDKGLASDNCDDGARRFGGPGGDLLFHALRRSTIGAEGFHGRVRDGIGCFAPRYGHQAGQDRRETRLAQRTAGRTAPPGLTRGPRAALKRVVRVSSERAGLPPCGPRPSPGHCSASGVAGATPGLLMVLAAGRGAKADRAISTGQLRGLPRFHLRPINVMVCHGSQRDLVLKGVSRLDAFSGYPVRT